MLQKFAIFLYFIAYTISLSAQSDSVYNYQVAIKGGYGFIITHSPTMEYITEQHISKIELNLEKNTTGNKEWHQHLGFPRIGISLTYFNFNNQHLGKGYSITPFLNFNLLKNNRANLNIKPAISAGYISKPFEAETNFKNSAIGSHLNIYFSVLVESEIRLHKNTGLLMGANFSHFSNTAFKAPNLGINLPTIEAGLYKKIGSKSRRNIADVKAFKPEKGHWTFSLGSGFNEINPPEGKRYTAAAFTIAREKKISFNSSLAGGVDFFYNPAIIDRLEYDSIYINKGYENLQVGVSIHHILHLGKLQNYVQIGYYLKSEDKKLGDIYQIVGGRYNISSKLDALLIFKTHLAKAEYLMIGVGIKIGKNEK